MPAPVLDRASSVPLYRQLEDILRQELASGHERLTENELMARFGLSRYTVRQALGRLAGEGLVDRRQRGGTRLKRQVEQPLGGLYSFTDSMRELGLAASSRVLSVRAVRTDQPLREQLTLADSELAVEVIRLRSVEDEPLMLESIWLPAARVPGLEGLDLTGSMYALLSERYGLSVTSARESIRPVTLAPWQASLLEVAAGSAAFFVERLSSQGQVPLEVRHSLIRGDRYLYSAQLSV